MSLELPQDDLNYHDEHYDDLDYADFNLDSEYYDLEIEQKELTPNLDAPRKIGQYSLRDFGYNSMLQNQIRTHESYYENITIDVAPAESKLTPEQITTSMETNHAVKRAPRFAQQLAEEDRLQLISPIESEYRDESRSELTEYQALQELDAFLQAVDYKLAKLKHTSSIRDRVRFDKIDPLVADLRENLTFIGEKEYNDATDAIANYWKSLLERNPDQQIYIATRWLDEHTHSADLNSNRVVKSDSYMLDNILAKFSDKELDKYAMRLVTHYDEITATAPKDLRVIFLDDWIISGQQLKDSTTNFARRYPELAGSMEVQLVAATEGRLKEGLVGVFSGTDGTSLSDSLPIRTVFVAHDADTSTDTGNVRTTGAHSSVDYNILDDIMLIDYRMDITDGLDELPVLSEIQRPYRKPGYELTHEARLRRARTWRLQNSGHSNIVGE